MNSYDFFLDPFGPWLSRKPSVYVISDSEMAKYKQKQAEAEIVELERLIDGHKQSIERLQANVELIRKDYPVLPETNTTNTTN